MLVYGANAVTLAFRCIIVNEVGNYVLQVCLLNFQFFFKIVHEVFFVFCNFFLYFFPCCRTILVLNSNDAVDCSVDVFFVFFGDCYSCFFEQNVQVTHVACHESECPFSNIYKYAYDLPNGNRLPYAHYLMGKKRKTT